MTAPRGVAAGSDVDQRIAEIEAANAEHVAQLAFILVEVKAARDRYDSSLRSLVEENAALTATVQQAYADVETAFAQVGKANELRLAAEDREFWICEAAQRVVDESGPDISPSLGTLDKLRAALAGGARASAPTETPDNATLCENCGNPRSAHPLDWTLGNGSRMRCGFTEPVETPERTPE